MASTGGRYAVITKGALTGAIACSNSGGYFGAELKLAGWDMVIFEGKSPTPVYLFIEDGEAKLLPADELWGKSVWETDEILHRKHQDPLIRISAIGRAGEEGILYACIVNDLHRAAGRSGVGTVMGSKNLKAIAVRGTKGVSVDDPKRFMRVTAEKKQVLADNAVTGQGLPTYGTQVLMNVINEVGALPTNNASLVQFDGATKISGEAMHEPRATDGKANLVTNQACFGCTIACGRVSRIDQNHYTVKNKPEYWGASGGLEYESAWSLGADTGIEDLEALTYANFIANEQGFDPISFGATVAAAMEMYERGAITDADTGGIALKFGSAEALTKLAELTGKGEGFGKEIGLGSKRLCDKYGHPELSMTVKGQEFPAYDPRGIQGMGLTYATSNRGACHLRSYTVASEVLGIPEKTDPLVSDGKAGLVKAFQDATAVVDSSGLCLFTTFAWSLDDIQPQIDAACAGEWSLDRLLELGERIWNLERQFNLDAGFTKADDTLPKRLLSEPAASGPAKGKVNELGKMLPEYYRIRGWDAEGVPSADTRARLGL
jgi:aldehyde:ferredoxin oxidoreductase